MTPKLAHILGITDHPVTSNDLCPIEDATESDIEMRKQLALLNLVSLAPVMTPAEIGTFLAQAGEAMLPSAKRSS